jgi:hypothetical protein
VQPRRIPPGFDKIESLRQRLWQILDICSQCGALAVGALQLRTIARERVATVRRNVTIDWTIRENVRVLVKRIVREHGYPPDKQETATRQFWSRQRCSPTAGRWASRPAGPG